jgi:biopolymer transport protein ExbB/TolQ
MVVVVLAMVALEIAIIVGRIGYLRRHRVDPAVLASRVLDDVAAGDLDRLARDLAAQPAIETGALAEAMRWYGAGPAVFDEVLTRAFKTRMRELELGLALLGALAVASPLAAIAAAVSSPEPIAAIAVGAALVVTVPALAVVRALRRRRETAEANVGVLGSALVKQMNRPHAREARAIEA